MFKLFRSENEWISFDFFNYSKIKIFHRDVHKQETERSSYYQFFVFDNLACSNGKFDIFLFLMIFFFNLVFKKLKKLLVIKIKKENNVEWK